MLCVDATLHLARLLLGIDWVLPNFATPTFDMTLAAPLTFAAICLWAFRGDVHLRGRSQHVRYYAIATYFTLSVPIHVSTYFTRSTELLRFVPGVVQLRDRLRATGRGYRHVAHESAPADQLIETQTSGRMTQSHARARHTWSSLL